MRVNIPRIKLEMAVQQMTSSELSRKSQVSHATISAILHGKTCTPNTLGKLAAALNIDPAELADQ